MEVPGRTAGGISWRVEGAGCSGCPESFGFSGETAEPWIVGRLEDELRFVAGCLVAVVLDEYDRVGILRLVIDGDAPGCQRIGGQPDGQGAAAGFSQLGEEPQGVPNSFQ